MEAGQEDQRQLLLSQLTFSGLSQNCSRYAANPFRRDRCTECGKGVRDHRAEAVSNDDIMVAIAHAQGAQGGHLILPAENGFGEMHLGGFMASGKAYIESRRITHVINAAKGLGSFFVGWAKQLPALAEQGVVFMRLEWTDTHDQKLYRDQPWDTLTEAVLFIEDARKRGGNVVVHCAQGKSRSTTVVVAYMMAKRGMGVEEAVKFVQAKRPEADPNSNFIAQLHEFHNSPELAQLRTQFAQ